MICPNLLVLLYEKWARHFETSVLFMCVWVNQGRSAFPLIPNSLFNLTKAALYVVCVELTCYYICTCLYLTTYSYKQTCVQTDCSAECSSVIQMLTNHRPMYQLCTQYSLSNSYCSLCTIISRFSPICIETNGVRPIYFLILTTIIVPRRPR